jgi:hypothetical protein
MAKVDIGAAVHFCSNMFQLLSIKSQDLKI